MSTITQNVCPKCNDFDISRDQHKPQIACCFNCGHQWADDFPRYQHDCLSCKFLGHHLGLDVYICYSTDRQYGTLIARYGDPGSEYQSVSLSSFKHDLTFKSNDNLCKTWDFYQAIMMGLSQLALANYPTK